MRRSEFLGVLAAALGAAFVLGVWKRLTRDGRENRRGFYVAGVRFSPRTAELSVGDRVIMKEARWNRERCVEIWSEAGQRIGYVPRRMIAEMDRAGSRRWRLASRNDEAVPWKKYWVERVS